MSESRQVLLAFNRGLVSPLAAARIDLKRMALSATVQTNWLPRVLGAMRLRPGTRYMHSTKSDAAAAHLPFIYAADDTAIVELTDAAMRVVVNDVLITRPAVSTAVTNGAFTTNLTGWTDSDESGGTSAWATGGYMSLLGNGVAYAIRDQQVTVAVGDQNVEHALSICVLRGTAMLRVGSSAGGSQYVAARELRQGYHSVAFTPTGDFHIRLSANTKTAALIDSIAVEAAGVMTVVTPWTAAMLDGVRFEQSGDVLFCADKNVRQQRIERWATRSWSVVDYLAVDGPYRGQNISETTLTAAALTGSTTLTASQAYFKSTNVGSIFRLSSVGQTVAADIAAENTFTNYIRVVGVGASRYFALYITGTWTGTVTLQRSVGAPGDWVDTANVYTVNSSVSINDALDNQIVYYRAGIKTGDYGTGTASVSLVYETGSIDGTCIVTGYTSETVVNIDVIEDMGATTATPVWWEGRWSARRGWPSAVCLHDGRLWWAGKDHISGSVSDAFSSFDDTVEGDSGPIARSIGAGPVDTINWLLSVGSLLVGTQGAELVAKASSLDEPLTPTAFSLKPASNLGSAAVRAVKVDTGGLFVQRCGTRLYELALDGATYNYASNDLTAIVPEISGTGITRVAVQRMPDTRVHCVREDGLVAILVFDRVEKVSCWVTYETDGLVEDVVVLPGTVEDSVYYLVNRTINGATKRYLEKWALDSESLGATATVLTDSTHVYSGVSTATMTGLDHLEGETVAVWANGKDLGTYTVVSGAITLSEATTAAYIGLPYTADFVSTSFSSASEIPLGQHQTIHHVALMLADTHAQGLRYGQDAAYLDDLPIIDDEGAAVATGKIWATYVGDAVEVNGSWGNNTRLYLQAASPRPCTVLAAIVSVTGHAK